MIIMMTRIIIIHERSKLSFTGEKSKISTFAMVMPLSGERHQLWRVEC
jgi:hypothetical protein